MPRPQIHTAKLGLDRGSAFACCVLRAAHDGSAGQIPGRADRRSIICASHRPTAAFALDSALKTACVCSMLYVDLIIIRYAS